MVNPFEVTFASLLNFNDSTLGPLPTRGMLSFIGYKSTTPPSQLKQWRKTLKNAWIENLNQPEKMVQLQEVANKIFTPEKFAALNKSLKALKIDDQIITQELDSLRRKLQVILLQKVERLTPPSSPSASSQSPQSCPPALERLNSRNMCIAPFEKKGITRAKSFTGEFESSSPLQLQSPLVKDFLDLRGAQISEEIEAEKYIDRVTTICNEPFGNGNYLKEEFIKLEDPAALLAMSKVIKPYSVIWLMQLAPSDPAVGYKMLFLLRSLPSGVLFDVLGSFTTNEDLIRLNAVFELLCLKVNVVIREGRPIIVYPNMPYYPVQVGPEKDWTVPAHDTFRKKMEKSLRELKKRFEESEQEFFSLKKELNHLKYNQVNPSFIQKVIDYKHQLLGLKQITSNFRILCCGMRGNNPILFSQESFLINLESSFEVRLKSFEWSSPSVLDRVRKQESEDTRLTLSTMQIVVGELMTESSTGKLTPDKIVNRLGMVQRQLQNLQLQIPQVLQSANYNRDGKEVQGFWDEIETSVFFENDFIDSTLASDCIVTWYIADSAFKILATGGILGVLPPKIVTGKEVNKTWQWVQHNLKQAGLATVGDLKRENIFNPILLEKYFSNSEVINKLKDCPFIDPYCSLANLNLYTVDDYKEAGIFGNLPDATIDNLRFHSVKLFEIANRNLNLLGLTIKENFANLLIYDMQALNRHLAQPRTIAKLKGIPVTL